MFKIYDWAFNEPFGDKTFDDFETAWEFIYTFYAETSDDKIDEILGEYLVLRADHAS